MRISLILAPVMLTSCWASGLAQEGVNVRVGRDIGVDTRGDGVRVQVGPLRIRVGGRSVRRSARVADRPPQRAISRFLSDRHLIDAPVFVGLDLSPGRVTDIVIDPQTGELRYAAISSGVIDAGRKQFPVPLQALRLEWGAQGLMWRTNFDGLTLANAPGFYDGQWPESADRDWAEEVDAYYGVVHDRGDVPENFGTDSRSADEQPQLEHTSRLIGLPLQNASAGTLGTVHRLIFDRDTGRIRYVAIQDHKPQTDSSRADAILLPIETLTVATAVHPEQLTTQLTAGQVMHAPRIRLTRALQPGHEDWTAGVDAWFNAASAKSTDRVAAE